MIEPARRLLESFQLIKILESFKQNKLSQNVTNKVHIKIFEIINSHHASTQIAKYFKQVNAKGARLSGIKLDDELVDQIKKLLHEVNTQNGILIPNNNHLDDKSLTQITDLIYAANSQEASLFTDFELKADLISAAEKLIQEINTKNGAPVTQIQLDKESITKLKNLIQEINIKNAFFTDFDLEPDNISQIKKLINALYYARLTFLDLENIDVRQFDHTYGNLKLLLSNTIDNAYQATYWATHLDVDLKDMFKEELAIILPQLNKIQQFAQNHAEETTEVIKTFPFSFTAGQVTGTAVDQMRPLGGDVDYNFLAQFSGRLPGYIDTLTTHIQKYSSQIKETEPKLNQQKLDELRNAALNLLNDIEQLKGGSFFVSLKFLNYIHIISNVITLSMSTLEQIGELSDSSQDLVRDKLALLKYTVLPTLFGLVDKIEVNAMVKPGTLSIPLMEKVKKFYQVLIYLPSKAIDFHAKGEEFLGIEDSRFIELRLELAYKRIDAANKALTKAKKTQEEANKFFEILKNPEYANLNMHELPPEVKEQLIKYYKIVQPYMKRLDVDFNELIINSLLDPESWSSYTAKAWGVATNTNWSSYITTPINLVKNTNWSSYMTNPWGVVTNTNWSSCITTPIGWVKNTNWLSYATKSTRLLTSYTDKPMRWLTSKPTANHVSFVLAKEKALQGLISKNENSQLFHIALNKDLIKSVHTQTKLVLFPYSDITSAFAINEAYALEIEPDRYKFILKKAEFLELEDAFITLMELVKKTIKKKNKVFSLELDDKAKKQYQALYNKLHPYFTLLVPTTQKSALLDFTNYLAAVLANKKITPKEIPQTANFLLLAKKSQAELTEIKKKWNNNKRDFYNLETGQFFRIKEFIAFSTHLEKTEFLTIEAACTRFHHLIQGATKADEQFLAVEHLDEETKKQCYLHYKKFRPYFGYLLPAEHRDAVANFDTYFTAALKNKAVDTNNIPSVALFSTLVEQERLYSTKIKSAWANKKDSLYSLETRKLLESADSAVIRTRNEKKITFSYAKKSIVLKSIEQLSADQALEVSQLYKNKYNKLQVAEQAYIKFIELLREKNITGNILNLAQLTPEEKDECRKLYNILQPYFICAVPTKNRSSVLMVDKYFVTALADKEIVPEEINKKTPPKAPPQELLIDEFFKLDKQFQDFITHIKSQWRQKDQAYYTQAEKKFISENEAATLSRKTSEDSRAHHLLKTTYSPEIHKFRIDLVELQTHFNQSMQRALVPRPKGVPYPEMEDPDQQLAQNNQVRVLKEIYNSLYHLEGIVVALEQLEDRDLQGTDATDQAPAQIEKGNGIWHFLKTKTPIITEGIKAASAKTEKGNYVWHLLQAYGHLNEIKKLALRLTTDPHYEMIARELVNKAQLFYAKFREHSGAYQVAPTEIPLEGKIQYNSLWYVLNAFYIGPKHLRSLKNTNYLTTEELNELHQRAKNATLIIQGLIKDSGSYFKLFLQTPKMVTLYQELTQKLNEFTTTTHDAVLHNIDKIRATIFTPMLLEADNWETKLGFAPGSFSEPLRRIVNEYYKGLVHSLNLNSEEHIALICDEASLKERTAIVKGHIAKAQKKITKVDSYYADIADLYNKIGAYKQKLNLFPPSKEEIGTAYTKALPKLMRLKLDKKIHIEPSIYSADHYFDKMCNDGLKEYDPKFTEVEAWITAGYHYYLGSKATHQMTLDSCTEKLTELTQLSTVEKNEKTQFIQKYTTDAFTKQVKYICNGDIDLQFGKEYRDKLGIYLQKFEEEIINKAKTTKDIDQSIEDLLQEKSHIFEKKHYNLYYQYDLVLVALAEFRVYLKRCKTNSIFEDKGTRNKKSAEITAIEAIASNKSLSIEERLEQIRTYVKDPNFKRIIFASCKTDILSLNNLKRCFFYLLEALYLYTPTRKVLYKNLYDSVGDSAKIDGLSQRFGLFAHPQKEDPPDIPVPDAVQPTL